MNATNEVSTAKVYVSTYHTYNSGSLLGEWVDLEDFLDASEFYTFLSKTLNKKYWKENDPEYMIQDFEGFPKSMYYESSVSEEIFEFIHNVPDDDKEVFSAFMDHWNFDTIEQTIEQFNDRRTGQDNWSDFAYDHAEMMFDKTFIDSGYFDFKCYERMLKECHTMVGDEIFRDD
jgi:antirestriction protein|tara:strand:+ start:4593 stop:5114 length:522 start_codon:yes stop_codon:yes gene_type:complete